MKVAQTKTGNKNNMKIMSNMKSLRSMSNNASKLNKRTTVSEKTLDFDDCLETDANERSTFNETKSYRVEREAKTKSQLSTARASRLVRRDGSKAVAARPLAASAVLTAPQLIACDKLVLDVHCSVDETELAIERADQLARDKVLVRATTKSRFYAHVYKLKFEGMCYAIFNMQPILHNIKTPIQLSFNPNTSHMCEADAQLLIDVWKQLFALRAKHIARSMLVRAIDICADSHNQVDDLLIDLDGAQVGEKYFVKTKSGGELQTIYVGGQGSPHHAIAYNQTTSDQYKAGVGSVTRRVPLKRTAELHLSHKLTTLRIESRRKFKKPVTLDQLAQVDDIFGRYKVHLVKPRRGVKLDVEFLAYLDCVRLRGINGARRWLTKCSSDGREGTARIAAFEKRLGKLAAPWWRPRDFNESLLTVLQKSPAWRFLRILERSGKTV